jgi:hypothetical protein
VSKGGLASPQEDLQTLEDTQESISGSQSFLRVLWLAFRTHSITTNVEKVEVEGHNITFWETHGLCGRELALKPFPHHLFTDQKLKEAVLGCGACGHIYSINHVVRSLLSGE